MRQCKHCNMRYVPSRKNNLYCSPKCKNAFNNEKYLKRHAALVETMMRIKMNAEIIRREFLFHGETVHLSHLTKKGFQVAFTNYRRADGHMIIDNWTLKEISRDFYKILPPKDFVK